MTVNNPRPDVVRVCLVGVLAVVLAGGVYIIATTTPTADSIYPKCPTHLLTGIHCPGCGTGRAAHFLLTGRPLEAVQCNLFAPFLLPFLVVIAFRGLLAWALRTPPSNRRPVRAVWLWLLVAALIIYTVLRNIPVEPFNRLAPKEVEPGIQATRP